MSKVSDDNSDDDGLLLWNLLVQLTEKSELKFISNQNHYQRFSLKFVSNQNHYQNHYLKTLTHRERYLNLLVVTTNALLSIKDLFCSEQVE